MAKLAFTIDMQPEWAVPDQLRERGVDPDAIELIVMTHLHYDHASGLSAFPNATVVVDQYEREAARKGSSLDGFLPHLSARPASSGARFRASSRRSTCSATASSA